MDCQAFRRLHSEFIDRTLSDTLLGAMFAHLHNCVRCARRDVALRRGLLVVHSLPVIQPSAGFAERLRRRLSVERLTASITRSREMPKHLDFGAVFNPNPRRIALS